MSRWAIVLAALALGACGTILDIQDAELDPLLVDNTGGNGGAGGAGGETGSVLCNDYCTTVQANCTGDNAVYADIALCNAPNR